jgi:hypothetical protein
MTPIDKETLERLCHHIHNACDCQFGITDIEGTLRALRAALDAAEAEKKEFERIIEREVMTALREAKEME